MSITDRDAFTGNVRDAVIREAIPAGYNAIRVATLLSRLVGRTPLSVRPRKESHE